MEYVERVLPWEPTWVYGVGDLQLGSQGCVPHLFEEDMDEARRDGALLIGMGDMVDYVRPTMRKLIKATETDDELTSALTERAVRYEDQVLGMIQGTSWLGMLGGHHYWDHGGGVTSDTKLAQAMNCPYLGDTGRIRLIFKDGRRRAEVVFRVWHGEGSGSFGSAMAKLERQAGHWDADIILMAHYSQLGSYKFHRIYDDAGVSYAKDVTLGLTGGYQKGYVDGLEIDGKKQGTYVEKRGLNPVSLGCLRLQLTPTDSGVRVRANV